MFDAVPVNANETVVVPAAVPAAAVAVNDALAVWPELTFIAEGLNVMPVAADTRTHTHPRKSGHKHTVHTRWYIAGRRSRA